jgi:hypothetical protein
MYRLALYSWLFFAVIALVWVPTIAWTFWNSYR